MIQCPFCHSTNTIRYSQQADAGRGTIRRYMRCRDCEYRFCTDEVLIEGNPKCAECRVRLLRGQVEDASNEEGMRSVKRTRICDRCKQKLVTVEVIVEKKFQRTKTEPWYMDGVFE